MLDALTLGPSDADSVLFLLHGLGADGHDLAPAVPYLNLPHTRVILPHAPVRPVTLNGGVAMRAWYDLRTLQPGPDRENSDHIRQAMAQVRELVLAERARGVASERMVIAGFSQGGAIATALALSFEEPLAGLVALSTYGVLVEEWDALVASHAAALSAFVGHGTTDPVVPLERGRELVEQLRRRVAEVRFRTYPVAHGLHGQELQDLGAWLGHRLAPRAPLTSTR
ncbi:MAG: alpha/beta fold hydrolase [Deltaproteobacteria bacterium]|nr:MAG: alpha/beta fold hydrolase [Deltaproteobacteria bacterium]